EHGSIPDESRTMNAKNLSATFILATGFVLLLYNGGSRFTMGLMLKPMADELNWTRATLSLTVTLFMVISAVVLPVIGRLVDRYRIRTVLLASVLLSSASIALMSVIQTPAQAVLLYGVLFALATAGTSIAPIGVMISRWFPKHLGLANSIAISGMGAGQLVIILVLTAQLESIGWRGAFVVLTALGLLLIVPLAFLSIPEPALGGAETATAPLGNAKSELKPSDLLRDSKLWYLLVIYAICGFQDFFVATHVVAFARDQGMGAVVAGNLFALMGLVGLAGVLMTGFVSDRFGPMLPTLICFAIRIVLFGLITVTTSVVAIISFALVYGFTFWITAPLTLVFVRKYFGTAHLGMLTGIVAMVHHGAGGLGAYAGGIVYDVSGSYQIVFQIMLIVSFAALLTTWGLSRIRITPR
ncbi:MFS transporter, partial [Gammaproteobacteria bacterium]|nr:MFS transporter [Gammaproteobacteria bacterium]